MIGWKDSTQNRDRASDTLRRLWRWGPTSPPTPPGRITPGRASANTLTRVTATAPSATSAVLVARRTGSARAPGLSFSLRKPVSAARVLCGIHPVASTRWRMVAPSDRCNRSMTRASLLPARGVSVLARSPTTSGPETLVASPCLSRSPPPIPHRRRWLSRQPSSVSARNPDPRRLGARRVSLPSLASLGPSRVSPALADFHENCASHKKLPQN
jgi:hypothetical protein